MEKIGIYLVAHGNVLTGQRKNTLAMYSKISQTQVSRKSDGAHVCASQGTAGNWRALSAFYS